MNPLEELNDFNKRLAKFLLQEADIEEIVRSQKDRVGVTFLENYQHECLNIIDMLKSTIDNINLMIDFMDEHVEEIDVHIHNVKTARYEFQENKDYLADVAGFGYDWYEEIMRDARYKNLHRKVEWVANPASGTIPRQRSKLNKYMDVKLDFGFKIPHVSRLENIPNCLYYLDSAEDSGIYICIGEEVYIKVPFPNVDSHSSPEGTSRCSHVTRDECDKHTGAAGPKKGLLSKAANLPTLGCKKVHLGDKLVKLGSQTRCHINPRFGNHKELKTDMEKTPESDIKTMLTYALSDLLLADMWYQKHDKNGVIIKDIDKIE